MECITALYILQCNPGVVVFWELETFEIWTPEVQSNSNEEPPFLQWEIGNHILQDKVQIIIPMSYHIILSEYFLSPTTTSLVKKKKIVYFSNFCLSFLSYIYACSRVVGPQPENCELLSPTQLELGLTHGSRYVMQL